MNYYIKNTLEETDSLEIGKFQYVSVMTSSEWLERKDIFDMGIELEIDLEQISATKAEVNYDSLTGTFCVPDRSNISGKSASFAFALDEKGIVFIDNSGLVKQLISNIIRTKRWTKPSLERFIYDFLEQIVYEDQSMLEKFDNELDMIEEDVLGNETDTDPLQRVSKIRSDLRDMRIHYEQLLDLAQELQENENNFFKKDCVRYFHLSEQRIERLRDIASSLREYAMQIRELYQSQLDVKQNRIMTLLTVITSIFMPLTLIAGWYGMNFKYMPELEMRHSYPIIIIISLVIVLGCLIFFKKKKWL